MTYKLLRICLFAYKYIYSFEQAITRNTTVKIQNQGNAIRDVSLVATTTQDV